MKLRNFIVCCVVLSGACAQPRTPPRDRVIALAELNSASLAALDPARTAFILNSAPLEAHGPHIPIASDVYQGDYCTRRMAEQVADSLPDWSIVLMPTLWYGIDGANLRCRKRNRNRRGDCSMDSGTRSESSDSIRSRISIHGVRPSYCLGGATGSGPTNLP